VSLRVVLADDHEMVRRGLRVCLEHEGIEVVGEAGSGTQALRLVHEHSPDVAVLDYQMPELNGIETARAISRERPATRSIILTMNAQERYVLEALRAGATGYVLKTQAIEDLVAAVRRVGEGEVYLSPSLARVVVEAYVAKDGAPADPLSPRERQVLQLIAEGRSTKEIASLLGISAKTADSHRARIGAKLDIHDVASLVRYAIRQGLTEA
jgi:two-component system, NarL family, response regulator NreC